MRAERRAACRRFSSNAVAGGVTPCVSDHARGFSPGRGKRPAAGFTPKLDGATLAMSNVTSLFRDVSPCMRRLEV